MEKIVPLDEQDINELRNQFKPKIIISLSISVISTLFIIGNHISDYSNTGVLFTLDVNIKIAAFVFASILFGYIMSFKTIKDIKNAEKIILGKKVEMKETREDYEAGSGVVGRVAMKMRPFQDYAVIIENTRYKVDKEFYENVREGDEVYFHLTKESRFLLRIEYK